MICRNGKHLKLDFQLSEEQELVRKSVRDFCETKYPSSYWRELDRKKEYPEAFVRDLTKEGFLSCLIPKEYGGAGLGILEASIILEEINRSGGNSAACHAQMYTMGTILKHGSGEQRKKYLPKIASGELRLQSFAITEPEAGIDTTRIQTKAVPNESGYVMNGHKIFTSRLQHSDLMLLLARTTPYDGVANKTQGMSIFLIDLRNARDSELRYKQIDTMINHETNELFIENLKVPEESLIGMEGEGFRYVLDSINAERILIASECIGDANFCLERAVDYAKSRIVFNRPIGQNQGVQFPLASTYAKIQAADLMRYKAATLFDQGKPCGSETNLAKLLSSEASLEAANVAMTTLGGYGMTRDADVERKFRESRLFIVAPIPNYMILSYISEHVLSMPRSY
jgi:acyl-CoA dehydrogenase